LIDAYLKTAIKFATLYVIKYAIFSQGEIIYIEYARKKFNFDLMFALRPAILQLYLELSIKRSIRREKHQGSENMKSFFNRVL
jgi:hypothetical protein